METAQSISTNFPYIGENGNWWYYDVEQGEYVDSGVDASITVTVGTTTTLPAGSNATVTNSGTATDPILNFGIPKGDKGDTGSSGATGATPNIPRDADGRAESGRSGKEDQEDRQAPRGLLQVFYRPSVA